MELSTGSLLKAIYLLSIVNEATVTKTQLHTKYFFPVERVVNNAVPVDDMCNDCDRAHHVETWRK